MCCLEEALLGEGGLAAYREREALCEPRLDVVAVVELTADPVAVMLLGGLVRGAAAAEGIEDQVTRLGGNEDRALGDHELQLVHTRADLELLVPVGRGVVPEVGEVQAFGVELIA